MKNKKLLNYSDYLQLSKLLESQSLMSDKNGQKAHDEMLFIIIHQTYELWFKQIIHELDLVAHLFSQKTINESSVSNAVLKLNRIIEIQKILIDQIRVLETMTAMDFLEFRDYLFPSSGFQSSQFRIIENKLGLHQSNRLSYMNKNYKDAIKSDEKDLVDASESASSIFDLLERWLERTPFLSFEGFDFWDKYSESVTTLLKKEENLIRNKPNQSEDELEFNLKAHKNTVLSFQAFLSSKKHETLIKKGEKRLSHRATKAALLIFLYRDEPILHSPFNLLSKLMDIDELFTNWRQRHATMVHRMIGGKIGTGGSSGHKYLSSAANKHKIFSDLSDLSTFFIKRSALPKLPKNIKISLGYNYQV